MSTSTSTSSSLRHLDLSVFAAAEAASPPPMPSLINTPPIFFSPSTINDIISPSPSPSSASLLPPPYSPIPEAALVGTGVAGAVVATALISTIASKMGCSLLGPLFSLLSFIFKKLLGIQRCAEIIRLPPRFRRSRKGNSSRSLDYAYGRADSNASRSVSRHYSSSNHYVNERRHRDGPYRDDVAIEVWEELEVSRKRLHDQVNDVGHMLRPTNSNISKFAAAEMRKLEAGINCIHDTTLVINQNVHESHEHIRTVNVSVEELEMAVDQRAVTSNIDVCRCSAASVEHIHTSTSAPEAQQTDNQILPQENTRRLQLAEMANDGVDQIDNINHQLLDSDKHNSPSTSRPAADLHPNETAENVAADHAGAAPVRSNANGTSTETRHFNADGTLMETRRYNADGTLLETRRETVNPRAKIIMAAVPPEYARDPPKHDLQIVPSSRHGTGSRSRPHRSDDERGTDKKVPRTRRPSKRRRLSKVAGVRMSCELSAHFWKYFVFCKTGTNYGADDKKDVDNADSSRPQNSVPDADGTSEKQPYSVHLPPLQSSAVEVPPTFPPIQFYQPSFWQTYPPPPTIITSGGGVGTAAYRMRSPSHIHGHYASEAAMPRSSMAPSANSSVGQASTAIVQVPPEAGIRQQYYSPSYQLVPIVNAAGSYIINGGGGNYGTVAMMAPVPVPPHHHNVTISEAAVMSNHAANSSTRNSETNSMADDAEDLQELTTTTCNHHHEEKAKSNNPGRTTDTPSGPSSLISGHEPMKTKLDRGEIMGGNLYGV